ncbi:hypothetical protein GOL99_12325 [Sinorhizobium medicae]|nr:hypothetical protein [Sinorhizobium medicae]
MVVVGGLSCKSSTPCSGWRFFHFVDDTNCRLALKAEDFFDFFADQNPRNAGGCGERRNIGDCGASLGLDLCDIGSHGAEIGLEGIDIGLHAGMAVHKMLEVRAERGDLADDIAEVLLGYAV